MRASIILLALLGTILVPGGAAEVCKTHKIQEGDTLWSIAEKHNLLTDDLLAALKQCINYDGTALFQVGQNICLPPYYDSCKYVQNAGGQASCQYYNVQEGDTMSSIAASFNIYLDNLVTLNKNIDQSKPLQKGMKVKLAPWGKTCPSLEESVQSCRYYKVKSGDFMYEIASMFNVQIGDLLAANPGLSADSPLTVGMPVKIPPFPAKCGAGVQALPPTDSVTTCRLYQVQLGDSLNSIALKFGLTINDLVGLNMELADPSMLTPGKKIKIPPFDDTCGDGILINGQIFNIDPASTAPASTATKPTAGAAVQTGVAPGASVVPVNVARVPAPAPSVVTAAAVAPVPAPVLGPALAPAPASVVNISTVGLVYVMKGMSTDEFLADSTSFTAGVAQAAGVPQEAVTIGLVTPVTPARRLMSASDIITVEASVTGDATNITTNLRAASQTNGTVASSTSSMGLEIYSLTLMMPDGTSEVLVNNPVAAAPAPGTSEDKGFFTVPVIAGIAAAGTILLLTIVITTVVCCKRAKDREQALPPAGVQAYVTTTSPGKYNKNGSYITHYNTVAQFSRLGRY